MLLLSASFSPPSTYTSPSVWRVRQQLFLKSTCCPLYQAIHQSQRFHCPAAPRAGTATTTLRRRGGERPCGQTAPHVVAGLDLGRGSAHGNQSAVRPQEHAPHTNVCSRGALARQSPSPCARTATWAAGNSTLAGHVPRPTGHLPQHTDSSSCRAPLRPRTLSW